MTGSSCATAKEQALLKGFEFPISSSGSCFYLSFGSCEMGIKWDKRGYYHLPVMHWGQTKLLTAESQRVTHFKVSPWRKHKGSREIHEIIQYTYMPTLPDYPGVPRIWHQYLGLPHRSSYLPDKIIFWAFLCLSLRFSPLLAQNSNFSYS